MLSFKKFVSVVAPAVACAVPQAASARDFEGEYLGVLGGAAILKTTGSNLVGPVDEKSTDPMVIALAGYRASIGRNSPLMIGVEGDIGFTVNHFDSRFSASAIAGYRIDDKALVFGRVGYASLSGIQTGGNSDNVDGLVLGGGAEIAMLDWLNLRVEYRNIDYGKTPPGILDNNLHFRGHEINGGVVFNF